MRNRLGTVNVRRKRLFLLGILLAVAVVTHDTAMAMHGHGAPSERTEQSPTRSELEPGGSKHIGHLLVPPVPDSGCPPRSCPDLIDCGLARLSSPSQTSVPGTDSSIAHLRSPGSERARAAGTNRFDRAPPGPPGVRRALLQVYLI